MEKAIFDPPFPIDALTATLRGAAEYIQRTNQSPVEMCAASVLAGGAICAQGLINIKWKEHGSTAPTSNILVCAESGERKSENDLIALAEIRKFCKDEVTAYANAKREHAKDVQIWEIKKKTLEKNFSKLLASESVSEAKHAENNLSNHLLTYPAEPPCAEILLSDVTPAALVTHLASICPCIGLVSDEGFPRYLLAEPETLNSLWQNVSRPAKRVSRDPTNTDDTRVSIYIQIQPKVFSRLLKRKSTLYDSGFFNRFMLVNAKSSQGTRIKVIDDNPKHEINKYYAAQRDALARYRGATLPTAQSISLTPNALSELTLFIHKIESELTPGRHFSNMRGAASKAGEMCVKLCGIMYIMEKMEGDVPIELVRKAIRITAWFLNQHRLYFHPLTPLEQDIVKLEKFFSLQASKGTYALDGPQLSRYAPGDDLRGSVDRLKTVLRAMESKGMVKLWEGPGKSWRVALDSWNPTILQDTKTPRESSKDQPDAWRFERFSRPVHKPSPPPPPALMTNHYELWPGAQAHI
jgi:hypothetical protein